MLRSKTIASFLCAAVLLAALPALADSGAQHQVGQTPPVKMGTSGGSVADKSKFWCCGGTLGSLVLYDGVRHILSNNHVLARSGAAKPGEDTVQPGLIDSNCSSAASNVVGDFAGDLVPLGTANVDAAISVARGSVDGSGAILDAGVPCNQTQSATIGLPVAKSGRTTGTTTGSVQSVNVNVNIQYQRGCGTGKKFTVGFTNQIAISPGSFSAGGDSGSLIVSNDGTPHPVGLLFAGSSSATIANPAGDVVRAFAKGGSHTFSWVGQTCYVPGGAAPPAPILGPSIEEIVRVTGVRDAYEGMLWALPGVHGIGVGASEADLAAGAIHLYVDLDSPVLVRGLPAEVGGVPIRVFPTEPFVAY